VEEKAILTTFPGFAEGFGLQSGNKPCNYFASSGV
jgi:hypothetical protein